MPHGTLEKAASRLLTWLAAFGSVKYTTASCAVFEHCGN